MVPFELDTDSKHGLKQVGKKFVFSINGVDPDDAGLYQVEVDGVKIDQREHSNTWYISVSFPPTVCWVAFIAVHTRLQWRNWQQSRPYVTIEMLGRRGQNHIGGGTVSNCLLFIPWLVWNLDELLSCCFESQYVELREATLMFLPPASLDGCRGYCGNWSAVFISAWKSIWAVLPYKGAMCRTTSCSISALLYY